MSTSRKENLRPEPVPIRKFIKLIFQLLLVLAVLGGLLIILFLCSPIALGSLWG
ncbi:MAG: hypothetical protein ABSF99_04380 [Anaerolineales bacterium]|jgi:hypothetical protein